MAQFVSTMDTYDSNRKREEFSDAIYMVDDEATPFFSLLGRTSVSSKHPEWMTDTLQPPGDNAHIEADMYSFEMPVEPLRVGNYTQTLRKAWLISNILEKVSKAGPQSDLGRQRRIKGLEWRRDAERALIKNAPSVVGDSNTPPRMGGFIAWLTTNDNRGAGGLDGGFNAGTGLVAAATNGTKRALTKTILDDVLSKAFIAGGNPKTFMVAPYLKGVFSSFMSDANVAPQRYMAPSSGPTKIVGAADEYLGPLGEVSIVPNRLMALDTDTARNGIVIDPNMVDVGVLRDVTERTPAEVSDATPRVLIGDLTLVMKNEAAHAVAADLFGINATT